MTSPSTIPIPGPIPDLTHRHRHDRRCWWDHRDARWHCGATAGTTDGSIR
ncbi:MAG: hypothetical protein INR72_15580 [Williamsia herbipolensis]|nr:hypothetical protein [Williamsia serinedens]MBE7162658.1 hypothetical protein [Williamsia herbipolensis]